MKSKSERIVSLISQIVFGACIPLLVAAIVYEWGGVMLATGILLPFSALLWWASDNDEED